MRTKIFKLGSCKVIVAALLPLMFVPPARSQNLTLIFPSDARRVLIPFYATDSPGGDYSDSFVAITNVAGGFNVTGTESTPGNFGFCSAHCIASQNSVVTATGTNLTIAGQVEISSAGTAVSSQNGSGSASWAGLSELFIGFTIDRSFTYSLRATTTMNTNLTETVPIAMVGISSNGDTPGSLPNIVAYGSTAYPGGTATAPSASGTNTGVFPAGTYYLVARVHSASGVDPTSSPMSEHFLATFNLNVTYVPPPVIMTFTRNSAGTFNLIWNASQAGKYHVVSSTNLMTWSEAIPPSAAPSGPNTNVVSIIPTSTAGYFRVEYLP